MKKIITSLLSLITIITSTSMYTIEKKSLINYYHYKKSWIEVHKNSKQKWVNAKGLSLDKLITNFDQQNIYWYFKNKQLTLKIDDQYQYHKVLKNNTLYINIIKPQSAMKPNLIYHFEKGIKGDQDIELNIMHQKVDYLYQYNKTIDAITFNELNKKIKTKFKPVLYQYHFEVKQKPKSNNDFSFSVKRYIYTGYIPEENMSQLSQNFEVQVMNNPEIKKSNNMINHSGNIISPMGKESFPSLEKQMQKYQKDKTIFDIKYSTNEHVKKSTDYFTSDYYIQTFSYIKLEKPGNYLLIKKENPTASFKHDLKLIPYTWEVSGTSSQKNYMHHNGKVISYFAQSNFSKDEKVVMPQNMQQELVTIGYKIVGDVRKDPTDELLPGFTISTPLIKLNSATNKDDKFKTLNFKLNKNILQVKVQNYITKKSSTYNLLWKKMTNKNQKHKSHTKKEDILKIAMLTALPSLGLIIISYYLIKHKFKR